MPRCCSVFGCSNNRKRNPDKNYFGFPSIRDRRGRDIVGGLEHRTLWVNAIKRANFTVDKVKSQSCVCSDHFLGGYPSNNKSHLDFVPSQNMGYVPGQLPSSGATAKYSGTRKRLLTMDTPENKLLNPTPSHDGILSGVNQINYEHITSENTTVLPNVNPTILRTEIQTSLPVENQTTFPEVIKVTAIRASDNATNIKSTSEVETQNKSSTIPKMESSESNEKNYKVLKMEDMINLWNELSKIAVPQCRCANLKTKK